MTHLTLQRTTSPTPSSKSATATLTSRISAFGAKLTRTISGSREELGDVPTLIGERSLSRGREFTSSGRGGFGNIRQASLSRDRPDGPDDFSNSRGREPVPATEGKIFSTGRGGAGNINIRSPSRDASGPTTPARGRSTHPQVTIDEEKEREREREVLSKALEREGAAPHSTGRGGLGNITRSLSRDPTSPPRPSINNNSNLRSPSRGLDEARSRSRSRGPVYHSTGRGGAGNMVFGETAEVGEDEEERRGVVLEGGLHSTGRGGVANLTSLHSPGVEQIVYTPGEMESTGRGGAGNIRGRSQSRPRV